MLQDRVIVNVMGITVRYVPVANATVGDAVRFALESLLRYAKDLNVHKYQVTLHGQPLNAARELASVPLTVSDMLTVEFV